MSSQCFIILAVVALGASAAPLVGTSGTYGPTVSETVVTPYHRTDAVTTPCGRSVVRSTALPVASYGLTAGSGFLGTTAGSFPVVGDGLMGTNAGIYSGVLGAGIAGTGAGVYQGVLGTGLAGTAAGFYPGMVGNGLIGTGIGGYHGVNGLTGSGVLGTGIGVFPGAGYGTNVVV